MNAQPAPNGGPPLPAALAAAPDHPEPSQLFDLPIETFGLKKSQLLCSE